MRDLFEKNVDEAKVAKQEKFSSMNRNELLNEVAANISLSKQNGTFNAEEVEKSIDLLSGHIPPEQIERMKQILKSFS